MSDFRVFVGDQELPIDGTLGELQMTHEVPAYGSEGGFLRSSPTASATFEITDPAFELVKDWAAGDRRIVSLTTEFPIPWSRWRRWLNAVLRFAWWPLGPAPLPTTYEASVTFPEMQIDRISFGNGMPLSVEMSTPSGEPEGKGG